MKAHFQCIVVGPTLRDVMCPSVVVCWLHLLGAFGPIAGDENLACFECLPFASFRFLQSLYVNSRYSVSQVFI